MVDRGSPFIAIHTHFLHGPIAQLAEQRTLNPFVVGSIPTGLTKQAVVLDYGFFFTDFLGGGRFLAACLCLFARVAELADAPDLGSGAARLKGSTPFSRTV